MVIPTLLPHRLAAVLLMFFAVSAAFADGRKSQPRLTPDQRAKVNKLLSEYRAAGNDVEKKQGICDKALSSAWPPRR